MVPFSNKHREVANPTSRVIVSSDLEFSNQYCRPVNIVFKLGISIPSLRTRIPGDPSHSYRKDRWRIHLFFWSSKLSGNYYDKVVQLALRVEKLTSERISRRNFFLKKKKGGLILYLDSCLKIVEVLILLEILLVQSALPNLSSLLNCPSLARHHQVLLLKVDRC